MKLRIESNGKPKGTSVFTEDGQEIEDVVSITWRIGGENKVGTAVIEVKAISVRLVGSQVQVVVVDDKPKKKEEPHAANGV